MAVSLAFILTTAGLVYYWMRPSQYILIPPPPLHLTPHDAIAIDGDDGFSKTALLEGWPGDGSPENPYLINGLDINQGGANGHCISISNTRVSFIISNCNLTGARYIPFASAGAGISLENVTNGVLVNNICNNNGYSGIYLRHSDSNTVANSTCNSNAVHGIWLADSDSNTVSDNICNYNGYRGIRLSDSYSNIVMSNTCNSNTEGGIQLFRSDTNTVARNTCSSNGEYGIFLDELHSNIIVNNICLGNTEHDIVVEFETTTTTITTPMTTSGTEDFDHEVPKFIEFVGLMGFAGIIVLGAGWTMLSGIRIFN
jgi:parallel beta-helix repeat protein